jgi:choline dehydrogenase-like flavoprotein
VKQEFDVIIVGAGSSGCALAARLSETPDRRVLLIEAGPHFGPMSAFPPEMAYARSLAVAMPGHPNNWSFTGQLFPGRVAPVARGKVVGGSSAVNGAVFIRGRPEDFDEWSRLGNPEWASEKMLPCFVKCETDHDFSGPDHGSNGPMPVRRIAESERRPASHAFVEACDELGFPDDPDKNATSSCGGVGPIPRNSIDGIRMNTAVTYLAACLDRPNLTLIDQCEVERILIRDKTAVGVAARRHGEEVTFNGSEIVLCASGIKTPHLLQVSGIGPADLLRSLDIPLVQDAPVGRGIQDHPSVAVPFRFEGAGRASSDEAIAPLQVGLHFTAPGSSIVGDLQISCLCATFRQSMETGRAKKGLLPSVPDYVAHPIRTLKALSGVSREVVVRQALNQDDLALLCNLHGASSRGEIRATSPSAQKAPFIDFNYLSHPDDVARMRAMVRTAAEILSAGSFQKLGVVTPGLGADVLNDDDRLDGWIRERLGTTYHTSCGARMGPSSDPDAVVDQYGRVHGVAGLRVCDLSISPTIVRRGPHATAVAISERMATFF